MAGVVDLESYVRRIGHKGELHPDIETLRSIMAGHVTSVPFENLDVLLGRPILLDPESLQRKLVQQERGGYCFEQNGLLLLVLREIGFDVTPLAGRVRMGVPREVVPPRTHLFLRVKIKDVDWLADCGVGGMSLSAPIRFSLDERQETPHDSRIRRDSGHGDHH
jgi:N-hydroxyarylamine O-acetyltransferase